MTKTILIILTPCLVVGLLLAGEINYSPSKHRAFPESYGINDKLEAAREKLEQEQQRLREVDEAEGTAELVVQTTEHDFGIMEPDRHGKHEFVIRNVGTAPLKLLDAGKTCLCVGFDVTPRIVPPGGQAIATLAWNTKFPTREYRHGASLRTNDPEVPLLKFRVQGSVMTELGFDLDALVFTKVWPGQPETGEVLLFSEQWDDFQIDDVTFSSPEFQVETQRVPDEELPLRSKAAYRLKITTPTHLPRGNFQEQLTLVAAATAGEHAGKSRQLTLGVQGYVAKRLSLFGSELSSEGLVDFGVVTQSKGKSATMFLRINDVQKDLDLQSVTVKPEFLQVELKPQHVEKGMYTLTITIPPYSDSGSFTADQAGKILLQFDHPRIEDLELDFHAVVLPSGS